MGRTTRGLLLVPVVGALACGDGRSGGGNPAATVATFGSTSAVSDTDPDPGSTGEGVDTGIQSGSSSAGATSDETDTFDDSGTTGNPVEPLTSCETLALGWTTNGQGGFTHSPAGGSPFDFSCVDMDGDAVRLELLGDALNVDLTELLAGGHIGALEFVVPVDHIVGSTTPDAPALTSGTTPTFDELVIINGGTIQGAGGAGGFGGACGVPSTTGEPGGVGLQVWLPTRVVNEFESDSIASQGRIWGGGGGGGGGGDGCDESMCGGTGGGGGGAGSLPGDGGGSQSPAELPALDGSGSCAGAGGTNWDGGVGTSDAGGQGGGVGGGPGLGGQTGYTDGGTYSTPGGAGGAPGCAVVHGDESLDIVGGDVRPPLGPDTACNV